MFELKLKIWILVFVFAIIKVTSSLEIENSLVSSSYGSKKDVGTCEDVCDHTYTLHTYPKPEHLSCCKRGCRFFSMIDVLGTDDNINITHHSCVASCEEAYKNVPEKAACIAGCDSQQNFASKREPQQPQTAHVLQPLMYVHTVYSNMVGHMSRLISSSWTLYIQEDDGKVIVSKDTPDILQEIINEGEGREMDEFGNGLLVSSNGNLKEFSGAALRRDEFIEVQQAMEHSNGKSSSERGGDWLSCVSRQSGVPRRLLLLFLLLAIMVMVWLCCATAATAQEQRVKNLQVNNDLSYLLLCNASEKVKIQPIEMKESSEILIEGLEAPPLPIKIKPEV